MPSTAGAPLGQGRETYTNGRCGEEARRGQVTTATRQSGDAETLVHRRHGILATAPVQRQNPHMPGRSRMARARLRGRA